MPIDFGRLMGESCPARGDTLREHLGLERPAGHIVTRGAV